MSASPDLWLEPISPPLRPSAIAALRANDPRGFLSRSRSDHGLDLVWRNARILKSRGIFEAALLHAFVDLRVNNSHWTIASLRHLFRSADRHKLLAAGDPLPGRGSYVLYRGVAGIASRRRVRGLSWTPDLTRAQWFAERFKDAFPDPAVFRVTVDASAVLAYIERSRGERCEPEFIVDLPPAVRPRRLPQVHT